MKIAVFVITLLVATGLIAFAVLYLRYARSPAGQWKRRVRAAAAEQMDRLDSARRNLQEIDRSLGIDKLRQEFLNRHLRGQPVEELTRFAGVGPVTASRLRDAGLTDVPSVERARLAGIPGIGPSREKDIRKALKQVWSEAESQFDAGACPEAVTFIAERKRREAGHGSQRTEAEQAIRTAEAGLAYLEEPARIARGISLFGHLFGHRPPELTDEVMNRPLSVPAQPSLTHRVSVGDTNRTHQPDASARAAQKLPVPQPATIAPPVPAAEVNGPPATPVPTFHSTAIPPPPVDDSPTARLRVAAGFGLAVAKADGRIAAAERKQVRAFLARRYAQPAELADRLDSLLAEIENDVPTIGDVLWDVRRVIPSESWPELYQFAVSVTDAAGERNARESGCLARVAEELGVGIATSPGTAGILPARADAGHLSDSLKAETHAGQMPAVPGDALSESDCRAALEITMGIPLSVELVRRQYRLLSDRFAPDKFGAHGPEFVQVATVKLDRVERAARQLLSAYNEPLEPPVEAPPADLRHNPDLDAVFGD